MNMKLTVDYRGWISENDGTPSLTSVTINGTVIYTGGTVITPTVKTGSFTANPSEASVYEFSGSSNTQSGTIILDSSLMAGQRYEFYINPGITTPTLTFAPNHGKLITGPEGAVTASLTVTTQGTWRSVAMTSDQNWIMSGR